MDTRDTPEQAELRRTARRLARELGPRTVADLDDRKRQRAPRRGGARRRLARAAPRRRRRRAARQRGRGGDHRRRAGGGRRRRPVRGPDPRRGSRPPGGRAPHRRRRGRLLARPDRCRGGVGPGDGHADPRRRRCRAGSRRGVRPGPRRRRLPPRAGRGRGRERRRRPHTHDPHESRPVFRCSPVPDQSRRLTRDDLDAWAALGLALTSADLVGLMRGVLDVTVAYARIAGSTASPSERSRPCSTSSPRPAV